MYIVLSSDEGAEQETINKPTDRKAKLAVFTALKSACGKIRGNVVIIFYRNNICL
ncbi:MAG: hypothetical protein WD052_04085 [Bacteroidales bacterium]